MPPDAMLNLLSALVTSAAGLGVAYLGWRTAKENARANRDADDREDGP